MSFGEDAGKNAVKEAEQNLVPELEAAGKRLIDYLIQRFDETVQKYAKLLSGESQASQGHQQKANDAPQVNSERLRGILDGKKTRL